MKKKRGSGGHNRISSPALKLLLVMKLMLILICTAGLLTSFGKSYSQTSNLTFEFKKSSIESILSYLENHTEYSFMYDNKKVDVSQVVDIHVKDKPIEDILNQLFDNQVNYQMVGKHIIITPKETQLGGTNQQQKSVSGKVTDSSGASLPGVSVVVKGTTKGVITDTSGNYSLSLVGSDATLVFSFIGMKTQEVSLAGKTVINIVLSEESVGIDEVVAIGYGTQSKKKVTGSIAKINSAEIQNVQSTNPADAIMGLASGVQVQASSGSTPGASPLIRVRGLSSLGSNNEPLYVVDGYPLPNSGQFSRINTSDIESIEIIKDAASAAIYGSRASNGVVIVTTKRGELGKNRFEISASYGMQAIAKKVSVMNRDQFVPFAIEAAKVRNVKYPDILDNPQDLPDTDWQDVIFRTAPTSEFSLSASGGTDKIKYSISAGLNSQTGILIGTDFKQGTLRANFDVTFSPKVKLGASFAPSYVVQNRRSTGGNYSSSGDNKIPSPIYTAMLMYPIIPVRYENGNYAQPNADPSTTQNGFFQVNLYNPLAVLELQRDNNKNFRILNNLYLEWEPLKGLKYRVQGGVSFEQTLNDYYIPATLSYDLGPSASLSNPLLGNIQASITNGRSFDYVWENTLTYTKNVKNHNFTGLLLFSRQKYSSTSITAEGAQGTFTTDIIQNPTAASTINSSISYGLNALTSFAARLNYDYNAKYLLSVALRRDGSSRFGPDNRFGYFPSVSAGWRVSEEKFFDSVKSVISELKLKGSYGETGNYGIGDFTWQSRISQSNYSFGNTRVAGKAESGFENRDLSWEKNRQVDIGLEIGFLKDRISLNVDAYKKTTTDMLFSRGLPAIVGYATSFSTNIGSMWNKGLEVSLSTKNLAGKFNWSTDFNISFNSNKVTNLDGREELDYLSALGGFWTNVYRIKVGDPIGNIYGFKMLGVYKDQADLDNSPKWVGGSSVGDYKVLDADDSGVVDANDMIKLGNGFPKFIYGLTNRFSYKDFDAIIVIQGSYGNSILNGGTRHGNVARGFFNATTDLIDNYYVPEKANGEAKYARPNYAGFATPSYATSYAVEDGSFLRVRSITLGYNVPQKLISRMKLNNARIYISGLNLLTFTKYTGYNPEPSLEGNSAYRPGSDQGTYPVSRNITIGLNVGF